MARGKAFRKEGFQTSPRVPDNAIFSGRKLHLICTKHMSILNSVIKIFIGDKAKKDVKALQPLVEAIKSFEPELQQLSHDELRQKTLGFKKQIEENCRELNEQIQALQEEAKNSQDIDKNEEFYSEIDKLEEDVYKYRAGHAE